MGERQPVERRRHGLAVRIAFIGAGAIDAGHAKVVVVDMPGAVLQRVWDTDESVARMVTVAFGAHFADAYRCQNRSFLSFVGTGAFPHGGALFQDGGCATAVAEVGAMASRSGQSVPVEIAARPEIYA